MRKIALAILLAILLPLAAIAQNAPATLPYHSVYGRIGAAVGDTGPGQAIPFATLSAFVGGGGGGGATVFNVKTTTGCGAAGNGTTDDTTAINNCIALFNSAGNGVLYFPAGAYKTTSALATITANGVVKGDGQTGLSNQLGSTSPNYGGVAALPATVINETSLTAALFTVASQTLIFQDLAIQNTSGGTPTAGSTGILVNSATQLTATGNTSTSSPTLTFSSVPASVVTGQGVFDVTTGKNIGVVQTVSLSTVTLVANAANAVSTNDVISFGGILYEKVDYQNIQVAGFYIGIDIKTGALWSMNNTNITGPVQYGVRINNTVNADAGDWFISNSSFYTAASGGPYSGAASALRLEGSGGAKITNIKINTGAAAATGFTHGIDVVGIGSTVDFQITNSSIENINGGSGININGSWPNVTIMGIQIGFGTPAHAITVTNNSNVVISGISAAAGISFSSTPISLTNCTNCYVSGLGGFSAPFSGGSLPDHDGSGGIGGTQYLTNTISGSDFRLNWQGPATFGTDFRVLQDATTTTQVSGFTAQNDTGTQAVLQATGSANTILANKALLASTGGIAVVTDNGVVTGGTDDVSIRPGGFNQEALLVSHSGGHIKATGQNFTAPTLTAGCNGSGSVVSGTDVSGTITGQTSVATSCTLSFGTAYGAAPNCAITGLSSPLTGAVTVGTGSIVVNFTSTANYKWSYICMGN